jgi:hypothetical protein
MCAHRSVLTVPLNAPTDNGYLRETQLGNDTRLVKGQPGRADSVEAPNSKEQPEPVVLECVLELLPIKVFVRGFWRVYRESVVDEGLLLFR